MTMGRGLLFLMLVIAMLSVLLSNQVVLLLLVDTAYTAVAWLDGVDIHNNRVPSYTTGNWPPVMKELDRVQVALEGKVPKELEGGIFVRGGGNPRCWPPLGKHHAFSGEPMLHRVELVSDNSARYSNSWIEGPHLNTETWEPWQKCHAISLGDINGGGLAIVRIILIFLRLKLSGRTRVELEKSQPGSTALIQHAGHLFTTTETFLPFEIKLTPGDVYSLGFSDFDGMLDNKVALQGKMFDIQKTGPRYGTFSAHPRIDPATGEMFWFSVNGGTDSLPRVSFGSLHKNGSIRDYLHIPLATPTPAFVHDMFLTPSYAIVVDTSLKKDMSRFKSFQTIVYFNASVTMKFGVMPRNDPSPEKIVWVDTGIPGHIWHTISAWEHQDDKITLFAPKFSSYNDEVDIHLSTEQPSILTKFTLDLTTRKATEEKILDLIVERPSWNAAYLEPTIAYLRSEGVNSREMGSEIVKFDLKKNEIMGRFGCKVECSFGEALFVPRENSSSEDDGYLMDIVYYPSTNSSGFIVWDAKTMDSNPIFNVDLPQRVPFGVHGLWMDKTNF